jgi:hypothetical protein
MLICHHAKRQPQRGSPNESMHMPLINVCLVMMTAKRFPGHSRAKMQSKMKTVMNKAIVPIMVK